MEDAGFILGAYGVTFAAILAYAWRVRWQARRAAEQLPDGAKPWI